MWCLCTSPRHCASISIVQAPLQAMNHITARIESGSTSKMDVPATIRKRRQYHLVTIIIIMLGLCLCTFFPRSILENMDARRDRTSTNLHGAALFPTEERQQTGIEATLGRFGALSIAVSALAHMLASMTIHERFDIRSTLSFALAAPAIAATYTFSASNFTASRSTEMEFCNRHMTFLAMSWLGNLGWADTITCTGLLFKACVDILGGRMERERVACESSTCEHSVI